MIWLPMFDLKPTTLTDTFTCLLSLVNKNFTLYLAHDEVYGSWVAVIDLSRVVGGGGWMWWMYAENTRGCS